MRNTVQAQHPAVVLRSSYQHLRAMLAIAAFAIVGLTVAVVVLAISNQKVTTSSATRAVPSAISTSALAEPGAKLDHRGLREGSNPSHDYLGPH